MPRLGMALLAAGTASAALTPKPESNFYYEPMVLVDNTNEGLYRRFVDRPEELTLLAANATHASAGDTCNTDVGCPHCMQTCGLWCWATVVVEMQELYGSALRANNSSSSSFSSFSSSAAPGATASSCFEEECAVVVDARGNAACCDADAGSDGACNAGATPATIQAELDELVAGATFEYVNAPPSEADVQAALLAGHPVLRLTTGHIDVVSGCSGDGTYSLTDSMYDAPFDSAFNDLLQSPYNSAAQWASSFFVKAR